MNLEIHRFLFNNARKNKKKSIYPIEIAKNISYKIVILDFCGGMPAKRCALEPKASGLKSKASGMKSKASGMNNKASGMNNKASGMKSKPRDMLSCFF